MNSQLHKEIPKSILGGSRNLGMLQKIHKTSPCVISDYISRMLHFVGPRYLLQVKMKRYHFEASPDHWSMCQPALRSNTSMILCRGRKKPRRHVSIAVRKVFASKTLALQNYFEPLQEHDRNWNLYLRRVDLCGWMIVTS